MDTNWKQWVYAKAEKIIKTAAFPLPLKEMAFRAVKFAVDCGQSHPFSFALRPIASHNNLHRWLGRGLVGLGLVLAIWHPIPGIAADDTGGVPTLVVLPEAQAKITTEESIKWPLNEAGEISQKFWLLHAGIDIRADKDTPVNPIMRGRVVETEYNQHGYGNKVVIQHNNGYQSLYAHLDKIIARTGQKVTTESIIGLSGNTGRSTGPHLHLEVHNESNQPVNPLSVLGER